MFKTIMVGLAILVGLVVIGWGLMAANIVSFGIQREATQQSQPYTETKVSLLHKLHNDYLQLTTEIAELKSDSSNQEIIQGKEAQKKNIVKRMKSEAQLISQSEVPDSIKVFLRSH